jgi:hypothetical protein
MRFLLLIPLIIFLTGCGRSNAWSVAAIRDQSDAGHRRLQVEVKVKDGIPWPLHLSVSAKDRASKRIESTLPRWTAHEVAPGLVAFVFSEPITSDTKPVTFDLDISARGYPRLHVQRSLGHF